MFWWVLAFFCLFLICFLAYYAIKFSNPYKLIMVFGRKGSGKTTYLCKLAHIWKKKGWNVYSSVEIPGTIPIRSEDVGFIQIPERSVILMDEVGMIYDNRNFKAFKPEVRDYFKLQRHYKHRVYLFSQTFDIDLKLRNLTDSMYLLVNYFGCITIGKQIRRKLVVVKPSPDAESRIADELIISPFLLTPFGARIFVWIPYWVKLFNSYEAPKLKEIPFAPMIEYPEGIRITKRGKIRTIHNFRKKDKNELE